MDTWKMQHLKGWLVLFIAFIAIGAMIVFGGRLSAASQLILWPVLAVVVGVGGLMGCYEALEPNEVLVVSRPGKPVKVMRNGAFVFPLISRTTRVRLRHMWIEFPSDQNAVLNRENRLITKDGLPVTTFARIEIKVGGEDHSILKVVQRFGDSSDHEVRDHFTKVLGGVIAKVIAETDSSDLSTKHNEFHAKVQGASRFEASGYEVVGVDAWRVTQLSIESAGLQEGDAVRARQIVAELASAENIERSKRERKEAEAEADKRIDKITQDVKEADAQKTKIDKTQQAKRDEIENATKLGELEQQKEEAIAKQRIAKERAIQTAELQRDVEVSRQRALKLIQEAQTERDEQQRRLVIGETAKKERILAAEAEYEAKMKVLQLAVKEQEEALRLRGDELRQNIANPGGDLDYVLKKEAILASANTAQEEARVLSAALGKANLTFVGDAAAAGELTRDYLKSFTLGSRAKELISLLDDVHVREAISSLRQVIWNDAGASKSFARPKDRERDSDDSRQAADQTFEP